jgi:phosphoglycolate phosphatase
VRSSVSWAWLTPKSCWKPTALVAPRGAPQPAVRGQGSLLRTGGYRYGCPMIRRVLLWDVDGTLVKTGGLGAAVFDVALERVLGVQPGVRVRMSGKTDPQIVREYLSDMGIDETPDLIEAVLGHIEKELAAVAATGRLAAEGMACPGAATILAELATHPTVLSTLVTGNVYPNAVVKVTAFGLDKWLDLRVGAYGSDNHDRTVLVPRAMSRVAEQTGWRADPNQVWVIGDTPRDLECARSAGVRCLLVGTGRYTADSLEGIGANAVLDDLSDTTAVVNLLTGV